MQIHFKRFSWHKRHPAVPHCLEANAIVEASCLRERRSRPKLLHNLPRMNTHNVDEAHIIFNSISENHAGHMQRSAQR